MKLNISAEWLMSSDATPDPTGFITPRDRAELKLRSETTQPGVPKGAAKKRLSHPLPKVTAAK